MRYYLVFILIIAVFTSCVNETKYRLFSLLSSEETGISFNNSIVSTEAFNIFSYRNFYNGGGVAIADFNNDGLPEIYLISNMASNKLFLNKGDMKFDDITDKAGVAGGKAWSTGVVVADVNGDGYLDIYVCNAGYLPEQSDQENELFINNGDLTFTEKAAEYGLNDNSFTTHAAFFDYDLDGDLDVYILNNSFMPVNTLNYSNQRELDAKDWPVKDFLKGGGDKLYRNDNGKFTDVTKEAGIYSSLIGFGLGVTVGDINGDQFPDLYISNDFFERDYLYVNQGDGTFIDEIELRMGHISLASMGADMADINNDGFPEIFVSEMLPDEEHRLRTEVLFENYPNYNLKLQRGFFHQFMHNTLQLNNGDNSFSEIAWYAGVAASDWSWGALLFDADNDGYRDIYICNGTFHDVTNQDFIHFFTDEVVQRMALTGEKDEIEYVINRMPSNMQYNRFFHNNHDLTFKEIGSKSGFDVKTFSNGAAYGDLDNDGDLDLVINNLNQEAFIYRNNSNKISENHFISVNLEGYGQNKFAIGSLVLAYSGNSVFNTYLMPSRGFQSSVDYKVVLGLGTTTFLDSLVVIWPDSKRTSIHMPHLDTAYVIKYDESTEPNFSNPYRSDSGRHYLTELKANFESHKEDDYVDFMAERLIIRMLSREGQIGAAADVNGDGLVDIFLGGASGQASQIYIQSEKGFFKKSIDIFVEDSHFEDTAAEFFDADQDGDMDLYVGSGGNHQPQSSGLFRDRLYLNDGKGNFYRANTQLPENNNNTSVVCTFDIDGDGDIDLFIGSRSVPMNYGIPPKSYIFENLGDGTFKDATVYFAPFLQSLGMVTDAKFVDILNDGEKELVIVGEWMSPVILKKNRSKYEIFNSNLSDYSGWWNVIAIDDVDGDGDQDLILGNRGENFYFTGSLEKPAKLWLWDFDNNGSIEKIITRNIDGKDMTIALKRELSDQVSLSENQMSYKDFADKAIQDLFPEKLLEKARKESGTWFKSSVAINEGGGQFTLMPLPTEVQLSSVNAILVADINGDGLHDLILGGNDSGFMPQYSKLDASFGHILMNEGKGNYRTIRPKESGFFVKGDIRDLIMLSYQNEDHFLVLLNNQTPRLFKKITNAK